MSPKCVFFFFSFGSSITPMNFFVCFFVSPLDMFKSTEKTNGKLTRKNSVLYFSPFRLYISITTNRRVQNLCVGFYWAPACVFVKQFQFFPTWKFFVRFFFLNNFVGHTQPHTSCKVCWSFICAIYCNFSLSAPRRDLFLEQLKITCLCPSSSLFCFFCFQLSLSSPFFVCGFRNFLSRFVWNSLRLIGQTSSFCVSLNSQ